MMLVEWVLPKMGYKGGFQVVSRHRVNDFLLVGSRCLFMVFGPGPKKPI